MGLLAFEVQRSRPQSHSVRRVQPALRSAAPRWVVADCSSGVLAQAVWAGPGGAARAAVRAAFLPAKAPAPRSAFLGGRLCSSPFEWRPAAPHAKPRQPSNRPACASVGWDGKWLRSSIKCPGCWDCILRDKSPANGLKTAILYRMGASGRAGDLKVLTGLPCPHPLALNLPPAALGGQVAQPGGGDALAIV